jgi:hypothetical protein
MGGIVGSFVREHPLASLSLLLVCCLLVLGIFQGEASAEEWSGEQIVASSGFNTVPEVVAEGGRVHVVWRHKAALSNDMELMYRQFDGRGWKGPDVLNVDSAISSGLSPRIGAGNGKVHVVYSDKTDGDEDIMYRMYEGGVWGAEVEISKDADSEDQTYPELAVDGDRVYVVWEEHTATSIDIYIRIYDGSNWLAEFELSQGTANQVQMKPAVAAHSGSAHVIWNEWDKVAHTYFVRYRFFDGATWHATVSVSEAQTTEPYTDVAAWGGLVHVVWSGGESSQVILLHRSLAFKWGPIEQIGRLDADFHDTWPSIAAEGRYVFVTFVGFINSAHDKEIMFTMYNGVNWTEPTEVGDYPDVRNQQEPHIAVNKGRIHLVWVKLIPGTDWTVSYRFANVDADTPVSQAVSPTVYWQFENSADIGWEASDDYGLTEVVLHWRYSADNVTWGDWAEWDRMDAHLALDATDSFEFDATYDGFYEFYTQAFDVWGRWDTPPETADLALGFDLLPPTGSVIIDDGDEATTNREVVLGITFTHNFTETMEAGPGPETIFTVRFTESGTWGSEPWETPTGTRPWTLSEGDGVKTVRYQVRDLAGRVSETYSDTIVYDTTAPTGSIAINDGATRTNISTVMLGLTFEDAGSGVDRILLSLTEDFHSHTDREPTATLQWVLEDGEGPKTLYYRVVDRAGWVSHTYNATIIVDTIPPEVMSGGPPDGSFDVNVSAPIILVFSEAMHPDSVEGGFSTVTGPNQVLGTITWAADGTEMTFTPTADLDPGRNYTVQVGITARDLAGNEMVNSFELSFTTAIADGNGGNGNGNGDGDDDGLPGWVWGLVILVVILIVGVVILMLRRRPGPP